ncbi:hypothetical protein [Delftia phage PhiW-14]|uniref:Uncharacterized protein n=1 Tax=Delftia phage PhiW-14 TaxID=665032 RepID=C9DGF4_BPW14|nr:hypothetical protein DP-phiW-14_gp184 [Delftia phage PhiW-14]ACV50205.1 hypothetical protein [Delftia phage PhiW-14]
MSVDATISIVGPGGSSTLGRLIMDNRPPLFKHIERDRLRVMHGELQDILFLLREFERREATPIGDQGFLAVKQTPELWDVLTALWARGLTGAFNAGLLLQGLGLTHEELKQAVGDREPEEGCCRPGKFLEDITFNRYHAIPTGKEITLDGAERISMCFPFAGRTLFCHPLNNDHVDAVDYRLKQRKLLNWFRAGMGWAILQSKLSS